MQVNYLHSHGLAHTELRLENVHVSPIDKHVKVSSLSFCLCLCKVVVFCPYNHALVLYHGP
jgi:serine/threonine protein kinase